jgi:hypothetical protein
MNLASLVSEDARLVGKAAVQMAASIARHRIAALRLDAGPRQG